MNDLIFTPSQFVDVFNQTLEAAYPIVTIEGELSELKISKGNWVYFNLKDESAIINFSGSQYKLAGVLEDGMMVRVVSRPVYHPKYRFSLNFETIMPVGEGSIRRAFELLRHKLETEGLFASERKRRLPELPKRIGLISSSQAAGYGDFMKVLEERWGDTTVTVADVRVQGERAASQIINALDYFNQQTQDVELLLIIRGGGSAEDLSVFNDESLTRSVAASRIPVLTAIGHERDLHLVDLAADEYVATPTKAAMTIFPDRHHLLDELKSDRNRLDGYIRQIVMDVRRRYAEELKAAMANSFKQAEALVTSFRKSLIAYNPDDVLQRGYSILTSRDSLVTSIQQVSKGQSLRAQIRDGIIESEITDVRQKT